jgi:hypothetical protein
MHPWYRTYRHAWESDSLDDHRIVVRPLFTAAFTVANLVRSHAADGVRTAVFTSASSKTAAIAAAQLAGVDVAVIGVTASHRTAFVESLGVYDSVVAYDAIDSIPVSGPSIVVDFAGNPKHLTAIHMRLGSGLRDSALVGYTHPGSVIDPPEHLTPQPRIFFSPHQEEMQRDAEGAEAYVARAESAETECVEAVSRWLHILPVTGPKSVDTAFRELLVGALRADEAFVCTLG